LKFTPDGKNLLVSYSAGYPYKKPYILALWDIQTSTAEILEHRDKSSFEFKFSSDGRYLIESTGLENQLWDIYSRKFIRKIREHSALDFMPYFSDDGRLLGTMGTPVGKVSKTKTGEVVDTWSLIDEEHKVPKWINRRYKLHVKEKDSIANFKQYSPKITALSFLGKEKIVSGGKDAVVRIWDVKSGALINTIQLEDDNNSLHSIAVSSDDKYIAVGYLDGDVPVISVDRGVVITELKGHRPGFSKPGEPSVHNKISVAFSSDSQLLSTAGSDGVVKMWKCSNWNLLWATELGSKSFVNDITFSRNSKYLGIGHESGPVTILDVDNGQEFKKHYGKVGFGVRFINNDAYLVSDLETWLCVYNMTNDNKVSIELTKRDFDSSINNDIPVGRFSISTDERLVFLPAKKLLCVDLVNHNQTRLHSNHSGSVRCSAISSNGEFLATGGYDGVIRIWAIK